MQTVETADKLRLGKTTDTQSERTVRDAVDALLDNKEQASVSAPWLRKLKREMLDLAAWCDAKVSCSRRRLAY